MSEFPTEYKNKTEKEADSFFKTIFKFRINLDKFYKRAKKNRTIHKGADN
jgi:hypothetical protein